MLKHLLSFALLLTLSLVTNHAQAFRCQKRPAPDCLDKRGQALPIMNEKVIHWKSNTPNLFEARARIRGVVVDIYPDRNGHNHFSIQVGPNREDTIEVVYNLHFGAIRDINYGAIVEACGDYITSFEDARYPASPDGAVIHWVHASRNQAKHKSGYVNVNREVTCGYYR